MKSPLSGRPFCGAWIRPHGHNEPKRLVVIGGQVRMGTGETIVALLATFAFTTTFVDPPRP